MAKATDAAFGRPLVTNVLRGLIVEAIIAFALEPEWHWCSGDYASWDFERSDGIRLEVKQSSYRQSWVAPASRKISPSFDVAPRTGRWENDVFVAEPGRAADIYVFAYHDVRDESADHRDPRQWTFYVVAADALPDVKRLALGSVRRLARPCVFPLLRQRVDQAASDILKHPPTMGTTD